MKALVPGYWSRCLVLLAVACLTAFGCAESDGPSGAEPPTGSQDPLPTSVVRVIAAIEGYSSGREASAAELEQAFSQAAELGVLEAQWLLLGERAIVSASSFDYEHARGGVFETELGPVALFVAEDSLAEQDAQVVRATWAGGSATWLEYFAADSATGSLTLGFAVDRAVVTLSLEDFVALQAGLGIGPGGVDREGSRRPLNECNTRIDNACDAVSSIVRTADVLICSLRSLPLLLMLSVPVCLPLGPAAPVCAAVLAGVAGVALCEAITPSAEALEAFCSAALGCSLRAYQGDTSCSCLDFAAEGCADQCVELIDKGLCWVIDRVGTKTSRNYRSPTTNAICRGAGFSGSRGPLSRTGEECKESLRSACDAALGKLGKTTKKHACECVCTVDLGLGTQACFDEDTSSGGEPPGGGPSSAGAGGQDGDHDGEHHGGGSDGEGGARNDGNGGSKSGGTSGGTGSPGSGGASGDEGEGEGEGGTGDDGGKAGTPGRVANGYSNGDPHVGTFDGLAYDLQAGGEFVLCERSDDPEGERVQTRHEPLSNELCPHVTLNTAVAARVGNARVGIYAGVAPSVLVDGAPVALADGEIVNLGAGAFLTRFALDTFELRWADGGKLLAHNARWGRGHRLDVTVDPPASWLGRTRGLLGNADGNARNDLRLPDGSVLAGSPSWEDYYLKFAASLRVTDENTLFDYGAGESSETFRRFAFPSKPATPSSLPDELRSEAETACSATGVSDRTLLDACVVDVACSNGDAAQGDWIVGVNPPAQSIELTATPVREALATTFAVTSGAHFETDDLTAACRAEFGPDAELADWLDVEGIPLTALDGWRTAVGLTSYDADELWLSWGGQRIGSAPRHYFIVWHDHRPVSGFLVHDQLDDHLIDLGSWYGWSRRVLCRTCDNGACSLTVGSQPSNAGDSCTDIRNRQGARGDGAYWVAPAAATGALEIECDMTTLGGGWTRLRDTFATTLDTTTLKTYLYVSGTAWYRSPPTTLAWSWNVGQELTGEYAYFDGRVSGTYSCSGSGEKPPFGVGCSMGPGPTQKTLPWSSPDPAAGRCTVCQDQPFAFGETPCQPDVTVFVRFEP